MANPNMIKGMPSVNPKGRNRAVFQDFPQRASHYLEKLSKSEILALASNDEKLDKLSSFDCLVIMQLAGALDRNDKLNLAAERERLYDRVMGKAVSRTELTGKDGQNFVVTIKGLETLPVKEGEFKEVLPVPGPVPGPVGADAPRFEGDVAALLPVLDNEPDGN
jgi:hypothetical protein